MASLPSQSKASIWLGILSNSKPDPIPLYRADYEQLQRLHPGIRPVRVIKSENHVPHIIMVDKQESIKLLKEHYNFQTKDEVTQGLSNATNSQP